MQGVLVQGSADFVVSASFVSVPLLSEVVGGSERRQVETGGGEARVRAWSAAPGRVVRARNLDRGRSRSGHEGGVIEAGMYRHGCDTPLLASNPCELVSIGPEGEFVPTARRHELEGTVGVI